MSRRRTSTRYSHPVLVEVFVGRVNFLFTVAKDALCRVSPWFRRELQAPSTYRGVNNQFIRLPHDDPATFSRFLQWMRNGPIQLASAEPFATRQERYMQLVMLYALATKLGVARLQNKMLDMVLATANFSSRALPREGVVRYVYQHTQTRSPLRRLFAVLFAYRSTVEDWRNPVNQAALASMPEFARDIVLAMAERLAQLFPQSRTAVIDIRPLYHPV